MDGTISPAAPAGDPQAYIAGLIDRASDPALPISGRNKLIDQIEAFHKGGGVIPPPASAFAPTQPAPVAEDQQQEQAASPEAGIESMLHEGVTVADADGFRSMQAAMSGAGVPDAYAGSAVAEISRLHAAGAFVDGAAHDKALQSCRVEIEKMHGADAKGILADGMAFLNDLAKRQPALADAIEEAAASPVLIRQAAMMHRKR